MRNTPKYSPTLPQMGNRPYSRKSHEDERRYRVFARQRLRTGNKLPGALEYIQNRPEITHIITVDDDIVIEDDRHLHYLAADARVFPDFAITFGGIRLERFPFRFGDGLSYLHKIKFVDCVPRGGISRRIVSSSPPVRQSPVFHFF
jgi:hypothetical protein